MKAGFSSSTSTEAPRIIPNCMARDREKNVYVGSQLEKCKDFGDIVFRRPVEKGYLVDWNTEKEIWEQEFFDGKAPLHCDPTETGLILTEAPNALPALQTNCDQIIFEEFQFASYLRCPGMLPPFCLSLIILTCVLCSAHTQRVQRCSGNLQTRPSPRSHETCSSSRGSTFDRLRLFPYNHNSSFTRTTFAIRYPPARYWWKAHDKLPDTTCVSAAI